MLVVFIILNMNNIPKLILAANQQEHWERFKAAHTAYKNHDISLTEFEREIKKAIPVLGKHTIMSILNGNGKGKKRTGGSLKIHPTVKKIAIGAASLIATALLSQLMKGEPIPRNVYDNSPYSDIFLTNKNMGGMSIRPPLKTFKRRGA